MTNSEKHKKNPLTEWLEEEEAPVRVQARAGAGAKLAKATTRRFRTAPRTEQPPAVEPALQREAAPAPRPQARASQANSKAHQLKQQRQRALRASDSSKPGRAAR